MVPGGLAIRTRQTDAAYVANVDNLLVAETGRSQVDLLLRWELKILPSSNAR